LTAINRQTNARNRGGIRNKRSVPEEELPRVTRSIYPTLEKTPQKIAQCGRQFANLGLPTCVQIPCLVDNFESRDAVRIVFQAFIWTETLFKNKISDIAIVTEVTSEMPTTSHGLAINGQREIKPVSIRQIFVFEGIKALIKKEIPIWPIILGVFLGLLLLSCIGLALWKLGFFQRKKWQHAHDLNAASRARPTQLIL
ncbi:Integrin, alpha, partial [Cichlidogyrus casuarinus]